MVEIVTSATRDAYMRAKLNNKPVPKIHEETGLPLNENGTVTLYHHTDAESAKKIAATKMLKSRGEPDVYMTTQHKTDTGYGNTAVAVDIHPKHLQLDDEFPSGRKDFRASTGKPGGSLALANAKVVEPDKD